MTPNRDGATGQFPVSAIDPAVYAADNAPAAIDLRDYQSATIHLAIGVGGITFTGTNRVDFVLTHSDDGTTYTMVGDDDLVKDALAPPTVTNGVVRSLTAAHAAATLQKLGYVGGKRFVKLLADFSGTHGTGTPITAIVVRSRATLRGVA
jgi:hypothetical protein